MTDVKKIIESIEEACEERVVEFDTEPCIEALRRLEKLEVLCVRVKKHLELNEKYRWVSEEEAELLVELCKVVGEDA